MERSLYPKPTGLSFSFQDNRLMTYVYFIVLRLSLNSQYRKKDNPQTNKTVDEGESCYWQLKPSRIIQNHGADGGEGMSQQVGSSHILKYEMKGPWLRKNPTRKLEKAGTRMRQDGENSSELKVSIRNSWSIPYLGA